MNKALLAVCCCCCCFMLTYCILIYLWHLLHLSELLCCHHTRAPQWELAQLDPH